MNELIPVLLIFLLVCAICVSFTKSVLSAIIVYSAFSLIMCIVWIFMESPDLAITEAAVGAGVTTLLFYATLKKLNLIDMQFNAENNLEDGKHMEHKVKRLNKKHTSISRLYVFGGLIVIILLAASLVMIAAHLPVLGDAADPANNIVSARYIEKGLEETGAVNIVAGMILDYRAFDTFGESNVLFVATICVTIMLRVDSKRKRKIKNDDSALKSSAFEVIEADDSTFEPVHDTILQKCSLILIPIIVVFGIYVVLNGHISPGGGFSGGALLGAGLILYLNAFGFEKTEKFMNAKVVKTVTLVALLVYCLAKSYSFFTGANGLESHIPLGVPGAILSSGLILILNICVGFVVACTMYSFYALVRRGRI